MNRPSKQKVQSLLDVLLNSSVDLSELESRFTSPTDEGIAFIPGDAGELKSKIKDVLKEMGIDKGFWDKIPLM